MAVRLSPAERALRDISEAHLLGDVRAEATRLGWLLYHPVVSQMSERGWPDCTLIRDGRVIFAELKRENGRTTPAQDRWLDSLAGAGCEVYLWKPSDFMSGEITRILSRPRDKVYETAFSAWLTTPLKQEGTDELVTDRCRPRRG